MAPVAAQQKNDPDVPTYIRKGWQVNNATDPSISTPARMSPVISVLPPIEENLGKEEPTNPGSSLYSEILKDEEYDIPAFLRRNVE